jgi:tetratricopeptide (TPR) repeat protein
MKRFIGLVIPAVFFAIAAQAQVDSNAKKQSLALNNEAVKLINTNADSALNLLNQATTIDSNNYAAYSNMATVYIEKRDFMAAIEANKKGLNARRDMAEAMVLLGMLYDQTSQPENAREQYEKAIKLFAERLAKSDKYKQANRENKAIAMVLAGQKEAGEKEINKLLAEDPKNEDLKVYINFNKVQYLKDYFGE